MISNRVPAHVRLDVIIPFWPDRREATSGHLFAGGCAFAGWNFGTLRELIVILRDQAKTAAATQQKASDCDDLKSRAGIHKKHCGIVAFAITMAKADTDDGEGRAGPRLHRSRRSNRMHCVGRSGLDSARQVIIGA
jgi:hypothetical protein